MSTRLRPSFSPAPRPFRLGVDPYRCATWSRQRQVRWARNAVAAATGRQLTTDLVARVRDLDGGSPRCRRIKAAVIESKTSLVGPMVAAKLLGEVGDSRRFPTKDEVAAHTGTAPPGGLQGQQVRHRLSRARDGKQPRPVHDGDRADPPPHRQVDLNGLGCRVEGHETERPAWRRNE